MHLHASVSQRKRGFTPVASSPTVIPGEPREEVGPASPHPEGLLVLQQVGDYCFLPGLGPGSLSPHSKPPSPSLCSETEDLDQDLSVKKFPYQPMPQPAQEPADKGEDKT